MEKELFRLVALPVLMYVGLTVTMDTAGALVSVSVYTGYLLVIYTGYIYSVPPCQSIYTGYIYLLVRVSILDTYTVNP